MAKSFTGEQTSRNWMGGGLLSEGLFVRVGFCPGGECPTFTFYSPLRNASMQWALLSSFMYFFLFFVVIIPKCQLPKFTENMLKIAQN